MRILDRIAARYVAETMTNPRTGGQQDWRCEPAAALRLWLIAGGAAQTGTDPVVTAASKQAGVQIREAAVAVGRKSN